MATAPATIPDLPAGRVRTMAALLDLPFVGTLITADATQDLRKTQEAFDRHSAAIEADLLDGITNTYDQRHRRDVAAAMAKVFSGMLVRR